MASLNRVELIGSILDNPQLRYTPSRKAVLSFMLDIENETDHFFPIYIWGELAEAFDKILRKGNRIYIEGKLQISEKIIVSEVTKLNDEEFEIDIDKYSVQIIAERVQFPVTKQIKDSTSRNKEKIENVIMALKTMIFDTKIDHEMILTLAKDLNSVVDKMD